MLFLVKSNKWFKDHEQACRLLCHLIVTSAFFKLRISVAHFYFGIFQSKYFWKPGNNNKMFFYQMLQRKEPETLGIYFSRHLLEKDQGCIWFLVLRLSHLCKLWYLSRCDRNLDNHLHCLWATSNNLHAVDKGWKTIQLSNQLDDLRNLEHGISNCCPTFNEYQFICLGGKIWI